MSKPGFITIITDCYDANATNRQIVRFNALFPGIPTHLARITNDIEASFNLVDALDASLGQPGIIIVNVAPRNKVQHKWQNGTPFGYFYYKGTLVISSVDAYTLSLVKSLRLTQSISLFDIPTVTRALVKEKLITTQEQERLCHTQFRSYEFLPRAARWLWSKQSLPVTQLPITEINDLPASTVCWIDNFGNIKTAHLAEQLKDRGQLNTRFGKIPFYNKLNEVPDSQAAIIIGSSGIEDRRFLELVIQGGNGAEKFHVKVGDKIIS